MNAGRVELDIVAIARDQVTATLREVNKSLEATKQKANEASGGARGLREGIASMTAGAKEGVKPLNQVREGFENLRSNATFVVGAVVSVGAALVGLIEHLVEAGTAQGELNARAKDFQIAGNALQSGIESLREKLGQARGDFASTYDAAIVGASDARLELDLVQKAIHEQTMAIAELKYESAGSDVARLFAAKHIASAEQDLAKNIGRRRELSKDIAEFERLNLEYLQQQNIEIGKQLLGRAIPGLGLALAVGAEKFAGQTPSRRGGGGGSRGAGSRARPGGEMAMLLAEDYENSERARKAFEEKTKEQDASSVAEMALALKLDYEARAEALDREKVAVDALAESYRSFAAGLSESFDAALPGLGGAVTQLGELAAQMAGVDDANKRAAMGVSGSIQAVTELAAVNAETAQEAFVYKGLGAAAAALGSAAVGDVKGAALHTAEAVAYGVAAAAAGGSGGSRAAAAAGGGGPSGLDRGGNNNGSSTVVNNIYVAPGTDPQAVGRELRRIDHATRGTGRGNPGV